MKNIAIGIDIGGTFTDIVAIDYVTGKSFVKKVLTTHGAPADGAISGLEFLFEETGIKPGDVCKLTHATTLFTNALIENKGVPTGLLSTSGFGDVIEIGSERRYDLYNIEIEEPRVLVPANLRCEIEGRLDAAGNELAPISRDEVLKSVANLEARGAKSIAVCLLHSYANPAHEKQVEQWIRESHPDLSVSLSWQVAPEIREFDRVCTTVANASIKPIASQYLEELDERIAALGIDSGILMMLSNGGLTDISEAKKKPIELLESGPAAGAISATWSGLRNDYQNLLAFDMGGTTAKLSLIENGQPAVAYQFEAARRKRFAEGSGIPIKITTIDLIEIGAGGGSIARSDAMGLLKVGPHSAGSEPGPASYNRGGTKGTVTDANLLLGYLSPEGFAAGGINVDPHLATKVLEPIAAELNSPVLDIVRGVHDIVAESMAGAARVHVAERGHDPQAFVMVCTGGGGPLHAYAVARKIGVRTIICPPGAGAASAFGLLVSPARSDRSLTVGFRPDVGSIESLEAQFQELESDARKSIEPLEDAFNPLVVTRHADGRYVGQGFTLTVTLPAGPYEGETFSNDEVRASLIQAFESAYKEKFGRTPPQVPIELVSLRASVSAMPARRFQPAQIHEGVSAEPDSYRQVFFEEAGGFLETPVFNRAQLAEGVELPGPLLVEDTGSTLVVGPSGRVKQLATGNLLVSIGVEDQ